MRLIKILPPALSLLMWGTLAGAQQPQGAAQDSPFYELMINGESFVVRKNRPTVLESKENPGIIYDVAVRAEPPRQMDLNTVRFNHDWLFTVHDNRDKELRRVRLVHEGGFTMMITDLGGPLPPDKQIQATTDLLKEVMAMCKGKKEVRVEDRHKLDLANGVLRGAVVRFTDSKPVAPDKTAPDKTAPDKTAPGKKEQDDDLSRHSMLVQTICGKEFAVTCITHYLDGDFEDIKLLIKQTAESFRPIPRAPPPSATQPGG